MKKNLFFLGCGKMGSIIASKIIEKKIFLPQDFLIFKPSVQNQIDGLTYINDYSQIPQSYKADMVFICIKPQNSQKILVEFAKLKIFHSNTIFISILAGKKTDFFADIFGEDKKIVRIMPNLGIEVDQGIIPIFFKNFALEDINLTTEISNIFNKMSLAFQIDDENSFHQFTALYGCGPAYIFLLQEIFEKIALQNNIPSHIAKNLTKKLFLGSALLSANSLDDFALLRKKVTSKKGVTETALKNLIKNNKLQKLFTKTIENGIKKSQRLAKK